MNTILNMGKTGLKAVQRKMYALSDNMANVYTNGYKRKDVSFQELLTNRIHENDVILSDNVDNASINMGTKIVVSINYQQGSFIESPGQFHMAIEGDGFFGVYDEDGNLFLTRNGAFHLNPDGSVVDDDGYYLSIDYEIIPENWGDGDITISKDGYIIQDLEEGSQVLGRVVLYRPAVLESLIPMGEGRYLPNENVDLYNSIDDGVDFGGIKQHYLEASNVDLAKSLTDMIIAQRSYSMNLRALETTDEIMSMINNIK